MLPHVLSDGFELGMAIQMREYAVHEDYAHIREYADADENLTYKYLLKIAILLSKNGSAWLCFQF